MQIDLDDELYKELKDIYENKSDKVEYPNFRNLINKIIKGWIVKVNKETPPEPKENAVRNDFGDRFKDRFTVEEKKEG